MCGNGGALCVLIAIVLLSYLRSEGANPRHATLLAQDIPPSRVTKVLDRFIMYYIRTADKLMRTSKWLDGMEGGIEVSSLSSRNSSFD